MAAGDGRGRLRASDADREHVIDSLKAVYVCGLVTKDEFDARVSQTFAARTCTELATIAADIPAGLAPAPPVVPALARAGAPVAANVTAEDRAIMSTARSFSIGSKSHAALLDVADGGQPHELWMKVGVHVALSGTSCPWAIGLKELRSAGWGRRVRECARSQP